MPCRYITVHNVICVHRTKTWLDTSKYLVNTVTKLSVNLTLDYTNQSFVNTVYDFGSCHSEHKKLPPPQIFKDGLYFKWYMKLHLLSLGKHPLMLYVEIIAVYSENDINILNTTVCVHQQVQNLRNDDFPPSVFMFFVYI